MEQAAVVEVRHQPNRLWRALGAVSAFGIAFGAGAAPALAETAHVEVDQRQAGADLGTVVQEVEQACQTSDFVEVDIKLAQPKNAGFKVTLGCPTGAANPSEVISNGLTAAAGPGETNHAATRADAVVRLQDALPLTDGLNYDRNTLVWSFMNGEGFGCARATSKKQIVQDMATAARSSNETPEHWTIIEAVRDVGECPDKLPDLYRNVAAAGHPQAAATIKNLISRAQRTANKVTKGTASASPTPENAAAWIERNCAGIPDKALKKDGTVAASKMPQFYQEVVTAKPGGPVAGIACAPSVLNYPDLDGGAGVAYLRSKATNGQGFVPLYSPQNGELVGYNMPSGAFLMLPDAVASGQLPQSFIDSPPTPEHFWFPQG